MKTQNKLINLLLLLLTTVFFINCRDNRNYEGTALLESYTVYQNGRYNLNLYLLENYNEKKSLKENLQDQDSIKCYIIIIDKKQKDSIEYLKKKIKKEYILCNISVELLDDKEHNFRVEKNIVEIENSKIRCDFYLVFDDFDSFKINEFLKVGTDSIHLLE